LSASQKEKAENRGRGQEGAIRGRERGNE